MKHFADTSVQDTQTVTITMVNNCTVANDFDFHFPCKNITHILHIWTYLSVPRNIGVPFNSIAPFDQFANFCHTELT